MPAFVSIVIPCRNAGRTIGRCVNSVLAQDVDCEIIVVDDKSTDNTLVELAPFTGSVTIVEGDGKGAPAARNIGLKYSKGEYVLFLDADDFLEVGYLSQFSNLFRETPDILVAGYRKLHKSLLDNPVFYTQDEIGSSHFSLLYLSKLVQTASFAWRRGFIDEIGRWDESLAAFQDIDLVLRAFSKRPDFRIVPSPSSFVVYTKEESTDTITNSTTREKHLSILRVLMRGQDLYIDMIREMKPVFGNYYYGLAVSSYGSGYNDIGDFALSQSRLLGYSANRLKGVRQKWLSKLKFSLRH